MRIPILATTAVLLSAAGAFSAEPADPGPLARTLWLIQRRGDASALEPRNDLRTKGALFKALGKANVLTLEGVKELIDPSTFAELAGPDGRLDQDEVREAVEAGVPESRRRLFPEVAAHCDALSTSFDRIDEAHRGAGDALAAWVAEHYRRGEPLHVVVICTGNSRRSLLGSTMGNVAAAYVGMPEIRFHSGGTAPTAFNPRTVAALREIGIVVEPTGDEAPRGEPATPNPISRVRWGTPGLPSEPAPEVLEFSKKYDDPANPARDFAALMVCGEADAGCPVVRGASVRVSMPYLDPKIYDGGRFEAAKYAERRDDLGRLLLSALLRARRRLPL